MGQQFIAKCGCGIETEVSIGSSRSFERSQTFYDWQHYISLAERKPGGLRNGAPFAGMPEPLKQL